MENAGSYRKIKTENRIFLSISVTSWYNENARDTADTERGIA